MSASGRTPEVPRLMTFVTGYARVVAVVGIRVLLRRHLCMAASNVIIKSPFRDDRHVGWTFMAEIGDKNELVVTDS